jgi:hypothetical protein
MKWPGHAVRRFEPHAPGMRPLISWTSLAGASQLLEREAIHSRITGYVETIVGCDQGLEMMKPGHSGN